MAIEGTRTDVLVIGAGIAGVSAAIEAARAGASVTLASLGDTFSGSSFFGGTWGLGLVGPSGDADADDFANTIFEVGRGVADPDLIRTLVAGIEPAVSWLEAMGVSLRGTVDAGQREYIPCFDHATRRWHGLERVSLRAAWGKELGRLGVTLLPHAELIDLIEDDGHVACAMLADHSRDAAILVPCGSVVLATGGLAGLYARRLTTDDVSAACHGIALAHGCSLTNVEFLQMMPGLVSPVAGVVANEKAFRFSSLPLAQELLDGRSGYGPFTCERTSKAVDLAICAAGPEGLELSYRLPDAPPELVATYFGWLEREHGVRPEDPVRLAMYAHASNGGIAIAPNTQCVGGPTGLFACGECAGGMHGADRVGGLASASALVFGRIAGVAAAREAGRGHAPAALVDAEWTWSPDTDAAAAELGATMAEHAMVMRTDEGLDSAERDVSRLFTQVMSTSGPVGEAWRGAATMRVCNQLVVAAGMLRSMRVRAESRGSHYRADYPAENPAMERQLSFTL